MKHKSPMEILNLLIKTDTADCNLSVHDRAVLATIVSHIHEKTIPTEGYKAWPSLDTIISRSGVQLSTLKRCIKTLIKDGWISKESGKGKGNNNTYYVNADKIVRAAALSGVKASDRKTGRTVVVEDAETHKRNTSGLVQSRHTEAVEPFKQPYYGDWYYSQADYDKAKRDREAEQRRMRELEEDENCAF